MDSRVDKLMEVIRKTVIKLFPELAGRYHLSASARITALGDGIQAQPLTNEGSDDAKTPVVKCQPLPYSLKVGNVVKLAFMYGDPSEPFLITRSTAVIGAYAGGKITIDGYGTKDALVAEYLKDHTREGDLTLPDATLSVKIKFKAPLKDGDQVAAVPIEEGERFIVIAKL
ncbi:DUF2577 family protein [Desulfotruncus alcoholivorax]|uniref:DUF2577 family protein n=1 Tax=Desulfotruncus alcoholivorax TaxID=265477 RepID=UPI0004202B8E|nr:DUF2577 family protein [Desulfotruncus alcoholivorax]